MVQEENIRVLMVRAICGGLLMGMGNLSPGISGGTLLLAVGIYTAFIGAIADVTQLKFKFKSLLVLVCVVGSALFTILMFAGLFRHLVANYRWIMYSVFIGLTFGGIPLIWRLSVPTTRSFWVATLGGIGMMVLMTLQLSGNPPGDDMSMLYFGTGGCVSAVAMILPGIDGGYLLLLLGLYEPILAAVDRLKQGLFAMDFDLIMSAMPVVVPVGIGVVVGVAGISNMLKWLLARYEKPTMGALFGLLVGAVVGLWPFQAGIRPVVGDLYRGKVLTAEAIEALNPSKWPIKFFEPTLAQVGIAVVLVGVGYLITTGIDAFGEHLRKKAGITS